MNGILNLGGDVSAWVWLIKCLIVVGVAIWFIAGIVKDLIKINKEKEDTGKTMPNWKRHLFRATIFIFAAFLLFVAFGSSEDRGVADFEKETGSLEVVNQAPDEKPIEQIRKEAQENKDEYLKKVEKESFADETKEADNYIKKALEKSGAE